MLRQRRGPHRQPQQLSAGRAGLLRRTSLRRHAGNRERCDRRRKAPSPGNAITDLRDKLQGYFRVASIQHYLVVDPDKRLVIHHTRGKDDVVGTRMITSGPIASIPPAPNCNCGFLQSCLNVVVPENANRPQPQNDRGAMPRRMLKGYGVTHVFHVPAVLRTTYAEMERRTEIKRLHVHGEKAAAYMADGYARASGRPGICMAQVIGALNLAAGLRDAWLAHSPVIAMTGGREPKTKFRKVYQEIDDMPAFEPVTKFNATIDDVARFPTWCGRRSAPRSPAVPGRCICSSAATRGRSTPKKPTWSRWSSRNFPACRRSGRSRMRQASVPR